MKNLQEIETKVAIGSEPWHFGTLCKDCLKRDELGNFTYQQAYHHADRSQPPVKIKRWMCGGGSKIVSVYPTKYFDYCFYHCNKRGLLHG